MDSRLKTAGMTAKEKGKVIQSVILSKEVLRLEQDGGKII